MRKQAISLWDLFITFAKIGTFTIGGGYAMIMLIRDELIRKDWISEEEFPDILALAQSAPGLLAVNFSIFAGYKLKGTKGSVAATLGSCLSPFIFILLIAMFFVGFRDNPVVIRIFSGIRPAVVAIILAPMLSISRNTNKKWWNWVITFVIMGLVAFLKVSPIYIVLVTIILSLAAAFLVQEKEGKR